MVRKCWRLVAIVLGSIILTLAVSGQVIALSVAMSLEELTTGASHIVVGKVSRLQSAWNAERTHITTQVTIAVEQQLKGATVSEVTIEVPGGQVDGRWEWVEGSPNFSAGEKVFLFLKASSTLGRLQVFGQGQGKFEIINGHVGQYTLAEFTSDVRLIISGNPRRLSQPLGNRPGNVGTTITNISPSTASAGTGTPIKVTGSGLGSQYYNSVQFTYGYSSGRTYTMASDIISWSDTQVIVTVPTATINGYPFSACSGPVFIQTPTGQSAPYPFSVTFGYGGAKWPGSNPIVTYKVNGTADRLAAIQRATQSWNAVTDKRFSFSYGGNFVAIQATNNGINEITWRNLGYSDIIGLATLYGSGTTITEADIEFNSMLLWSSTTPQNNEIDVETVAVHELGHWLMLRDLYGNVPGYPQDSSKVMYGYGGYGLINRVLQVGDQTGIRWIYPASLIPPSVITVDAVDIGSDRATLNGYLNYLGTATSVAVSFEYGNTSAYGNSSTPQIKSTTGVFNNVLTGLNRGTTYNFRARADAGSNGIATGENAQFTTAATSPPTVVTNQATDLLSNAVRLNGTLTYMGTAPTVSVLFEYGTTTQYGASSDAETLSSPASFYKSVSNLNAGTLYHFRAKADGGAHGVGTGSDVTFTTHTPPSVITREADAISQTSALLHGSLTSLGSATSVTVSYDYGTTIQYGLTSTAEVLTQALEFLHRVTNLSPVTLYHFRARADGGAYGVVVGNDAVFTTLAFVPPVVTTQAATNIGATSASLNGNLNSFGSATTAGVSFEYGTGTSYGSSTLPQTKNSIGTFVANIAGLTSSTTYHFRARGDGGSHGVGFGADAYFSTASANVPTVTTQIATGVTVSGATLNGTLESLGTATSVNVAFEYGPTSAFGYTTTLEAKTATGAFSAILSGLLPGSVYYFKAKADGGTAGSAYGLMRSFSTLRQYVNGKIVFASDRDGGMEIYTMGSDGSGQVRLTDRPPAENREPTFSLDGVKIVFISNRTGPYELYRMAHDGQGQYSIISGISSESPCWSPDGNRIAFRYNNDIYYIDFTGNNLTRLTNASGWMPRDPAWSPDSTRIAYSRGSTAGQVWVINEDGSNDHQLTNLPGPNGQPAWSPDGSRIAFTSEGEIYIINSDGSNLMRLTNNSYHDSSPTWSPDGSRIAFVSNRDHANGEIYSMSIDGSSVQRLTSNASSEQHPSWGAVPTPGVVTLSASSVTAASATLNGNLIAKGTAYTVNVSFNYGTTTSYGTSTTPDAKTATGAFTQNITGLTSNTLYNFQAAANGGAHGTATGANATFTTLRTAPTVTTTPATAIGTRIATLNGNLTSLGDASGTPPTVNVNFEYGTTTSYGTTTTAQAKTATGAFSANITGLLPGTGYNFRAKADGGLAGTANGANATFTTDTGARILVNEGNLLVVPPGGAQNNVPLAIRNIPVLGTGNGVGGFTFNLTWNKDVVRIDSLTAATVSGWTITPGAPNNTNGSATIAGFTSTSYLTADTVIGNLNFTAVGAAGTSTTIGISVASLGDKNGAAIDSTATGAAVSVVSAIAETALSSGLDTGDVAVVNVKINRGKDPATGNTVPVPGGVVAFSATASSSQATGRTGALVGMEFAGVREVSPYLSPTFNASTGAFGVSNIASPEQPNNSTVVKLLMKLTGDKDTTYTLNVAFSQIIAATGGVNIPEDSAKSLTFRRGDASGNGTVDIFDAMYIAQYVVGTRPASQINAVNAACTKHDTGGDKVDIFDAMYIAQMVVGVRNNRFE